MFLIDKYFKDSTNYVWHQSIIEKILESFDNHNEIYSKLKNTDNHEVSRIINILDSGILRFANFQHLVVYGKPGSGKEFLVDKLLERIYNKENTELNEIEYIINGYGNSKTKVLIKQSKFHIVIEPSSNGFDKYLIQEIIQNYAKSELLNIIKYRKLFKIVIINKIDNLSYYAQASLRRTMEKYSESCKFIFICDQLSKIIEPIRSRCILFRTSLPTNEQILETLLHISDKDNINISLENYNEIITNSENCIVLPKLDDNRELTHLPTKAINAKYIDAAIQ
jgi:replication factor C subunit 3/5